MEDHLIFLVGPPRSGSTLLMRVLNATSHIYSRPEPHIMTPLAHLGFWEVVDQAPYDQLQAQQSIREFVKDLPGGESSYWGACRAYTDELYGRILETSTGGERYFLDKTPANGLILPFLAKVYPRAKYIVLTRHPAAILSSNANSFFEGDFQASVDFNPILSRYIPAMADFLRQQEVAFVHVAYEDLVSQPEEVLQRISSYLGIPYEPEALNYGSTEVSGKGLGDPIGVNQHDRPVTSSVHKWASELAADRSKFEIVAREIAGILPEDLEIWGNPMASLWKPLEEADPAAYRKSGGPWNSFRVQRWVLMKLRRNIQENWFGRIVKKLRFACDVLLRG